LKLHFIKSLQRAKVPAFLFPSQRYKRITCCSSRHSCPRNKARIAHKYFTHHPSRYTGV